MLQLVGAFPCSEMKWVLLNSGDRQPYSMYVNWELRPRILLATNLAYPNGILDFSGRSGLATESDFPDTV